MFKFVIVIVIVIVCIVTIGGFWFKSNFKILRAATLLSYFSQGPSNRKKASIDTNFQKLRIKDSLSKCLTNFFKSRTIKASIFYTDHTIILRTI